MTYIDRKTLSERLKISVWSSYQIFSARKRLGVIASDKVVLFLNQARMNGEPSVEFVPTDIKTAEELEAETGILAKRIMTWCKRKKNAPPHFRYNSHLLRFRLASFEQWLRRNT